MSILAQGGGEIVAVILLVVVMIVAAVCSQARLNDPNDKEAIHTHEIESVCKLAPNGIFRVSIIRQSGNLYKDPETIASREDSILRVSKTFERAKIDALWIHENTPERFKGWRLAHSDRGSAEGKKVGGFLIERIGDAAEETMSPKKDPFAGEPDVYKL
jgi:hypothetical protein